MSTNKKLLKRFLNKPKDFTYDELRKLLKFFGYEEDSLGKTSGSRVVFINKETLHIIRLHKPHPGNELKIYQIDQLMETLKNQEVI